MAMDNGNGPQRAAVSCFKLYFPLIWFLVEFPLFKEKSRPISPVGNFYPFFLPEINKSQNCFIGAGFFGKIPSS